MAAEDDNKPSGEDTPEAGAPEAPDAKDAFKRGMGLLWHAARTVATDVKREVDKAHVRESLEQAGRELEHAAQDAAKALEHFIGRVAPPAGKPADTPDDDEPPPEGGKPVDADMPKDGGKDAKGERRDVRILVDDD